MSTTMMSWCLSACEQLLKMWGIGKAIWDQKGDIRDVISIGKLVRKNDRPEEVE